MNEILSIGHSSLGFDQFVSTLSAFGATAIADVRSAPYSRLFPQYNRERIKSDLNSAGLAYVFLGKELGGRPSQPEYYTDGTADYEKMSRAPEFNLGINRLISGTKNHKVAMMCSEKDPLDCHRCLLVGRSLAENGIVVRHIVSESKSVLQCEIEKRLLLMSGQESPDLFKPHADRVNEAYRDRSFKVAFSNKVSRASVANNYRG